MKKHISRLILALALASPAAIASEEKVKRWNSADSMGCLMLRECTKGVTEVNSWEELSRLSGATTNDRTIKAEVDEMILNLQDLDIPVVLADSMYFPHNTTGLYDVRGNQMFLNKRYMKDTNRLIKTLRHEGWHAVQDCMAGGLDNTMIAVVFTSDKVPPMWKEIVANTYPKNVREWEQEAKWKATEVGETSYGLKMCAVAPLWEVYEPTPMTREWLVDQGFIK